MPLRLTDEGFAAIKSSGTLFGKISDALGISPYTLADRLRDRKLENGEKNNPDFTQAAVLQLVAEETGKAPDELITEVLPVNSNAK